MRYNRRVTLLFGLSSSCTNPTAVALHPLPCALKLYLCWNSCAPPNCHVHPYVISALFLQCALAQLPKDPYAIVLHSSFLIDVQGSYQSGYTALQVRFPHVYCLVEEKCPPAT
jgi:hypothetical protein